MALRLVNLHKQETFVWSKDPGKGTDDETKFLYRTLDAYEQAYLRDRLTTIERMPRMEAGDTPESMMDRMQTRTEVNKVAVDAVRIACNGIENLQDDEGKPVEFKTDTANIAGKAKVVVADDILRALPSELCMEFYQQIMEGSMVSESAEKNSVPGSSPLNSSRKETAPPARKSSASSGDTTATQ